MDITVAGTTKTVTATGTEQSKTVRVGAFFFFGESYPVDVSASIPGVETVDGTINADDGVVNLKTVGGGDGPNDGTISGTVTDESGNALSGATVTADGQSATTASDGSYSLTVAPGDYTVEASADGYVSDSQQVTVTEGNTTTADFTLTTDVGTISGTVTDESGSALSSATVTAGSQSTTTASDGSYSLSVASGDYTVEANADGFQADTQQVSVSPGGSATADFALTAEAPNNGTISGTVTDASGNAIGGADVSADNGASTTTASDGSYSLSVAPGDYDVTADATDFQSSTQTVTVTEGATTTADFTLDAIQPDDGTITGTVTDTSGNALAGATVTAGSQSTTTASDGTYSLTLTPDTYTVEANADGYQSDTQSVTVPEGGSVTADFSLTAEDGTISGTVTDTSGSALSGATVTADGQSATTASDGSYSLTVAPGDYTVEANADGYQADTQQVSVSPGGSATADFSLTAEDGTISGVVEDTNGNNLGGATVTAGGQSATTASDGSYSLTVAPGTYTVVANTDGYLAANQTVTVGPGGSATADFALEQDGSDDPIPFTAYVRGEESYLHTGTPNNSRPILYSRCRDGSPSPAEQGADFLPTDGCIQIDGTVFPENNTWRGSVDFPPARDIINETSSDTIGNVYFRANLTTAGQAGGTFNVDTGRTSLETTVDIGITVWTIGSIFDVSSPTANPYDQVTSNSDNRLSDPGCNLPAVSINVSTEKSYQTGSPFPATSTVSGQRINDSDVAKLVSDDFNVDTAEGCGSVFGVNINDQVNAEQGLPAGPGDNEAAYLTEFNLQTGS